MNDNKWQSMDTAPKDKGILVWGQPTDLEMDGNVLVSFNAPLAVSVYWDEIDEAYTVMGGSWLGPFVLNPKGWQPLPTKGPKDA